MGTLITVFGSLNADFVFAVQDIARPGETVLASDLNIMAGGKGGNQALAAAKAGASVQLVGAVGSDGNADIALAGLQRAGVDLSAIARVERPTGMATIMVDQSGENSIAVFPGANDLAQSTQVSDAQLKAGAALLLQMEVPKSEIEALIDRARSLGARTILNLAPAGEISLEALRSIDILIANETEFAFIQTLLGRDATAPSHEAIQSVSRALSTSVIVTLGAKGIRAVHNAEVVHQPALPIEPVDTVGAGDAFAGAFAAALDAGQSFRDALKYGAVAGALTCTKTGAQTALPDLETIQAHLGDLDAAE